MARPPKATVDYFPHDSDASDGKTLTIIQAKFGNDGYAFWFKLLQILGKQVGHYYDFNNAADWEFLLAKTHQKDTETTIEILKTLALLGAIDAELFENGIIWCQNFVDRVADAYSRTINGAPKRPDFLVIVPLVNVSVNNNGENPTLSAQIEIEREIEIEKEIYTSANFELFWSAYPKKKSKIDAEKAFKKINPAAELLETMLSALEQTKKTVGWQQDGGKYIPNPATWLNGRRWEDEISAKEGRKDATHKQGSGKLPQIYTRPDELLQ